MRALKDKERIILISKVFLHLNGPSTAKEICDYIQCCPVKIQKWLNPSVISGLLRQHKSIRSEKEGNKTRVYSLRE